MMQENLTKNEVEKIIKDFPVQPLRNRVVITVNKEIKLGGLDLEDNILSETQYIIAGEIIFRDMKVSPGEKVLIDLKRLSKPVRVEIDNTYQTIDKIEIDPIEVEGMVYAIIDDTYVKAIDNR